MRTPSEMVALMIGYDITSGTPERSDWSGNCNNLLKVLAHTRGCSLAAAVIRDSVLCRFVEVRDRVAATATPELGRYLTTLSTMIRGYVDWTYATTRYEAATFSSGQVCDSPQASGPEPIPSIAWWWQV